MFKPTFKFFTKNKPLVIAVVPLIALLALEGFSNGSLIKAITWIRSYPSEFFLSYILMFGIINIFYILPKRAYLVIATIFLSLFSCLGFISQQKLKVKGDPLLPSDFLLAKEAIGISDHFRNVFVVLGILLAVTVALVRLILKHIARERKQRYSSIVFVSSFLVVFVFYSFFNSIQNVFALQLISYSQSLNYQQNGTMLGFLMDTEYLKIAKPSNYQESTINDIIQKNTPSYPVNADFKPNIIFVMSEAFWDPTLMKNVSFSQDPIPFFHSLQKSQTSGTMLSAVYGGGTANTEFEALTGFSTQFLPNGSIAYDQYVNRPLEALPTILSRQGYATSAIHTYDDWFYSRDKVYQQEGFDKFISKEFLNNPEYKGPYIRDTVLTQQILNQVKETNKPDFIYSVSMQDHGPYDTTEDPGNTIKASSANLSPDSQAILDNYANRISDVDQSLKQLIDGLKQINQPTMVIFYGDHLPMLGDNYSVYKEAGFIENGNTYQDYLNLHSVPFVTWNNFSTTVHHNLNLSANFMGTFALQLAQKSGSPMTDLLSNLMQNGTDIIINKDYWNAANIPANTFADYESLQYDLLFGKEYSYDILPDHRPPSKTNYIQGDALPTVADVIPSEGSLIIEGNNFVENDKVYLNGKEVKTTYLNPNSLSIDLPESLVKATIQVKLSDSRNKVISKSNVYKNN
ncbi:phosphoglycerol transferase family protein, alkaline phosphatase superfamily [Desulfosporosinus acidiphilus SJ4]|uniref:Phosphoglycerol transferase family protein, alkaline phosphatase superfamily n=1 Tax=Desulfosporosinus acidiphilus (strain DSM 22704 / JCM 16185 / SJ4) TaxID=646529 RepID=I4D1R7_DESAJ|nr:LTA synthase family protein [Desulfosporosinus acidiphilus]AFM39741.1 phosphoglycerol transferase family protein, alkaline phosphatase superfamily [Desulfosporosinus acidiphilus SJ4]